MKKAAGNLEKTVLCVCSTFQSIWKATAKSLHSLIGPGVLN